MHDTFDLLLLDCPPGMSLLSENVLRAADAVVVPLIPAPLSVRMLDQLPEFVAANGGSDIQFLTSFSMVDHRKSLHAQVISNARLRHPTILATEVPYWSDIERMTVRRAPLPAFASRSAAAQVCIALWAEISGRVAMT